VRMFLPVTGGPGGEFRIVGKAVIGGAMTGVTGPDDKAGTGVPATGLADVDDSGDPPGAGLVPQAARQAVTRLAVSIAVKACARVVRRMLIGRLAAPGGSVPGPRVGPGAGSPGVGGCRGVEISGRGPQDPDV
jgi:hypothetical protein